MGPIASTPAVGGEPAPHPPDPVGARLEAALHRAFRGIRAEAPPRLASALDHAVFPGGARVRPRLCVAVATAGRCSSPELVDATACAIELLHCASLVHDDLPCFDDADTRRGRPSVHRAYGEATAVLVGDALIVEAFGLVARAGVADAAVAARVPALITLLAEAAGPVRGLVAGQAWESEPTVPLGPYHQAKTAALFVAAACGGAIAAGRDPAAWRAVGELLGEAYQVADDLLDAHASAAVAGKPTGQDAVHDRPNAVASLGTGGAVARLQDLIAAAADAVPREPGRDDVRSLVARLARRLLPPGLEQTAA